jgi:hypothetical protein
MIFAAYRAFRRSRWYKRLVWAAAAFLVYTLLGFFAVPPLIKWRMLKRLPGITKRHVAIRQVRFNPLTLSLTLRGLSLTEPDGGRFAGWKELYVNFQASSLFRWAWTFKEIRLTEPYGEVRLLKNGQINFADMFQQTEPKPAKPAAATSSGVPRVNVFLLTITNAFFGFEDHTRRTPFRTEYHPINIRLTDLTTRPGTATPYSFKAENDSHTSLAWDGDITVQPFASKGAIDIRGADPTRYQPYLDDFTRARVTSATADLRLDYAFAAGTNGVDLVVSNGAFRLADLKIQDPATSETVLAVPSFTVGNASLNLRDRQARLGTINITSLDMLARINKDRSINLLSLLEPSGTNSPPATPSRQVTPPTTNEPPAPWTVTVGEFHLEDAGATFQDQTHGTPFETRLHPFHLSVTNFTTATNVDAQYDFALATEASESVTGRGTVALSPLHSLGTVKVAGVELKKYWPYAEQNLRGGILAGKLDLAGSYACALAGTNLSLVLSNGAVAVSDLQLRDAATNETILVLGGFGLEDIGASLEDRKATIGRATTRDTKVILRRLADGSINLLNLLPVPPAQAPATNVLTTAGTSLPPAPSRGAAPWQVSLREFDLQQWQVRWEDLTLPTPALLQADDIGLNVKGLSTDTRRPIELALGLKLNHAGAISLRGTAQAEPQEASLEVGVQGLDLRPFQPYLNPHVRLSINSGALNIRGHADYQTAETNRPNAAFRGEVSITNLLTTDQSQFEQFIKWAGVYVEGLDFAWHPDHVKVAAVRVDGLKTSLLLDTNRQANLLSVFPQTTNAAPAPAANHSPAKPATEAAAVPSPPLPISVGLLALTNVSFRFGDASLQPNCRFEIEELNGTVKGLSSDSTAAADVDLSGRVDEQAPFALIGKVNPLASQITLDLTFSNANMQLPSFTPYLEKYGGHPLNKGRLSMDLHYDIHQNELKARNSFRIDQLTLGPRNNSPNATKLPVKLAIALLKDRNGRIELDVPVAGHLNDPEFRVGPIIWKAVLNLLTKAATSPFKLLGALVGGGEELSFVDFEPGTARLLDGETNKIAKLTKALVERPAINLEIDSTVDPQADRHALARLEVRNRLTAARLAELAATTQTPPPAETFEVDPQNYERLLRAEVLRVYGTNWAAGMAELRSAALTNAALASLSGNTNRPAAATAKPKGKLALALQVLASWNPFERKHSPAGAARLQAISDARLLRDNPALAALTPEVMEHLLALRTQVPAEAFIALMKERTRTVQQDLLRSGELQADRLFIVAPKPVGPGSQGQARASLSLN